MENIEVFYIVLYRKYIELVENIYYIVILVKCIFYIQKWYIFIIFCSEKESKNE